jgi:hypothetical protein
VSIALNKGTKAYEGPSPPAGLDAGGPRYVRVTALRRNGRVRMRQAAEGVATLASPEAG